MVKYDYKVIKKVVGNLLQRLIMDYLCSIKEIHTLSTGSVNKITNAYENGFYVETLISRAKYEAGTKNQPYDVIPNSFLIETWNLLTDLRKIHAGDLKTSKGRSSFLLALFSQLPFVEETSRAGRSAIGLKEYYVHDLPEADLPSVLEFLKEVKDGKYHPQLLSCQIQDKNLQRLKSSQRLGLRLLGFINEDFNLNQELIDEFYYSGDNKTFLKKQVCKMPFFTMIHLLLSAPSSLSEMEKSKALNELGLLVVRNPIQGNLMEESVADKYIRNTLSWIQYINLLEEGIKENRTSDKIGVITVNISNKSRQGICYSNISLIKKALLQNEDNVLPYPEILLYVKKNWVNLNSSTDEIKKIVDLALHAPKSFFYEVEEGLWGIKDKIDSRLNHIYEYMNPRKVPLRIPDMKYRLKVYETDDILRQMLLSDIRFSQIDNTPYWILSEWTIINNLAYDYIVNREFRGIEKEKVIENVVRNNHLDITKIIFLPQFDDRFTVYGNRIELKYPAGINHNEKQHVEVPVEIDEEVGRLSYKIINYIKEKKTAISTDQIISHVFQISHNEPSFSIYQGAIRKLLEVVAETKEVEEHKWLYIHTQEDLQLVNNNYVYYAVRNSTPPVENLKEMIIDSNPNSTQKNIYAPLNLGNECKDTNDKQYAYHTVSYYDRVKGYFIIPKVLINQSILFRQDKSGKITILHDENQYQWNWEKKDSKYYFFGDGLMDFFADYLIEPGHKLSFEIDKQIVFLIHVHKVGFDERYASEQQRYLDIGRLVKESQAVNKSIFSLMLETLAVHPSGLHWSVLQDKISEKRSTTKNTVTNLLSRNECFEQVEGKKGYWKINISKLSRYYINEENEQMIEPVVTLSFHGEDEEKPDGNQGLETEDLVKEATEETTIEIDLARLQQLDTSAFIQQIEDLLIEIVQKETDFKDAISKKVYKNFTIGNIAEIAELYNKVEEHILFFNRVREVVSERERRIQE